jgi:hypothetical protein
MFKRDAHLMQSYPIQIDIEKESGTWLWAVGLTHFGALLSLLLTQLLSNPKGKNTRQGHHHGASLQKILILLLCKMRCVMA